MIDLGFNIALSFGAQYKAEDTASYLLYNYNRAALKNSPVSGELFCKHLNLGIFCDYIFYGGYSNGLGVLCSDGQCVYNGYGKSLNVPKDSVVVEKTIIDSGNYKLYNYTLIKLCAEYLAGLSDKGITQAQSVQLSFGLDSTVSTNNTVISLATLADMVCDDRFDKIENFAHCLALPKNRFKQAVNELFDYFQLNRNSASGSINLDYIVAELSQMFQVPDVLILLRLKSLNYL